MNLYFIVWRVIDRRDNSQIVECALVLAPGHAEASGWGIAEAKRRWPENLGYGQAEMEAHFFCGAADNHLNLVPHVNGSQVKIKLVPVEG